MLHRIVEGPSQKISSVAFIPPHYMVTHVYILRGRLYGLFRSVEAIRSHGIGCNPWLSPIRSLTLTTSPPPPPSHQPPLRAHIRARAPLHSPPR